MNDVGTVGIRHGNLVFTLQFEKQKKRSVGLNNHGSDFDMAVRRLCRDIHQVRRVGDLVFVRSSVSLVLAKTPESNARTRKER